MEIISDNGSFGLPEHPSAWPSSLTTKYKGNLHTNIPFEKSILGARARYKVLGIFFSFSNFLKIIKKGLLKYFTSFKHLLFSNWLLTVPLQKLVLQKYVDWAVVKFSLI